LGDEAAAAAACTRECEMMLIVDYNAVTLWNLDNQQPHMLAAHHPRLQHDADMM
jgi:hypothetical protein